MVVVRRDHRADRGGVGRRRARGVARAPATAARRSTIDCLAAPPSNRSEILVRLDELLAAYQPAPEGAPLVGEVLVRARALAELAGADGVTEVGLTFVGESVSALAVERAWTEAEIDELLESVAHELDMDPQATRVAVFVRAIADPRLLELPPRVAIETRLRLLRAFTAVTEASLWAVDVDGATNFVVYVGEGSPPRRARALAQALLEGREDDVAGGARARLHALPVNRWERPYAALVVKVDLSVGEGALVLAAEVARTLAVSLETEALLGRNAERERSLVDSSERRLVRLGFDLHDGPMQDTAALGAEIRHFREQLAEALADDPQRAPLVGRADDLEARLRALDAELRQIAQSLNTPVVMRVPFRDVLDRELATFERHTGIKAALRVSGNFDRLSTSQRIALLRLVQEALANVQNHSQASRVAIQLVSGRTHVQATIEDDGVGFEVQETLVAAARRGRLGLVGMGERIRLLGGRLDIVSQPGARTTIRASIPAWRPPEATPPAPEG